MESVPGPRSTDAEAVVVVRWPAEETRRRDAAAGGRPRLLLVAPDAAPPAVDDPLEDWIRLPAGEADVRARVDTLARRGRSLRLPRVEPGGVLVLGRQRVALSPVEAELARALVDRFGAVVGRDTLMRTAWPDEPPSRNALDVHVLRLRRRIEGLGLEITTVRSRGYLLQVRAADA